MLGLIRLNRDFHGVVGMKTGVKCNNTDICIGDMVKVINDNAENGCFEGVVAIFGRKVSVMGLAAIPLNEFNLTEVVKSHKDLQEGDYVNDYFTVRKLVGICEEDLGSESNFEVEDIKFDKGLCGLIRSEEFCEIESEYNLKRTDFEILDDEFKYQDDWLAFYTFRFKYKGVIYSFEYWKHTSPNCCDSEVTSEYAIRES